VITASEMEMDQWVMDHGVKWVTIFGWITWVVGQCQWPINP